MSIYVPAEAYREIFKIAWEEGIRYWTIEFEVSKPLVPPNPLRYNVERIIWAPRERSVDLAGPLIYIINCFIDESAILDGRFAAEFDALVGRFRLWDYVDGLIGVFDIVDLAGFKEGSCIHYTPNTDPDVLLAYD